jgi:hypothetical protein
MSRMAFPATLLLLLISVSASSLATSLSVSRMDWPSIKPLSWSGTFDLLGPPTLIPIHSMNGAILYRLYCSSWVSSQNDEPQWLTGGDNYEGDFECLLTDAEPGSPAPRATLLNYDAEDTSPYHFNEGSFQWNELLGGCWNDPSWGADRTFYLRGMRLRIRVVQIEITEFYQDKTLNTTHPIISQVTAQITAQPDPQATTALARAPSKPERGACLGAAPR